MGNCLSNEPWRSLKKNELESGKAIVQSPSSRSRLASQINSEGNPPVSSDAKGGTLTESNVVSIPTTDVVETVPVTSSYATAAEAPKDVEELQLMSSFKDVNIFTYKELTLATDCFRPDLILGEGGFGLVYKGVIDEHVRAGFKSTKVAVKELNPDGYQGDREWLAEVNYLGQFSHPNLVRLIGYCCEDQHRLLVYEYMSCGSLETHLFRRRNTLTWPIRMKIALDAAKGLAFLHGAERPIIYRDFKTSNILLDADFNAKLSDFGLAKEGPMGDQTHVSTRVMGTYGYAAPEYVMTGHLTARSDVYGFGVVLLEMIVGKRALDKHRPNPEHNLVDWARPLLVRISKLVRIIDPRMQGQYSSKTASRVGELAYRCLSENPKARPTMSEVVEMLDNYNQEEMMYQKNKAAGFVQETAEREPSASPPTARGTPQQQPQPRMSESGGMATTTNRRRVNSRNGRSRSDPPPNEFDHRHNPLYSHCQVKDSVP